MCWRIRLTAREYHRKFFVCDGSPTNCWCLGESDWHFPGQILPNQKHLESKMVSSPIILGSNHSAAIPILQACSRHPYSLTFGKYQPKPRKLILFTWVHFYQSFKMLTFGDWSGTYLGLAGNKQNCSKPHVIWQDGKRSQYILVRKQANSLTNVG